MSLSPRAQVTLTVAGFCVAIAAACVSRKDIVPPLTPAPSAPMARHGLHLWVQEGSPACAALVTELHKPEAAQALTRFALIEEHGPSFRSWCWGVRGYPTLIVTDGYDHELSRHEGAMGAAALGAWLDDFNSK